MKIPAGWRIAPLDQVAAIQTGIAKNGKRPANPVTLPYLRVANVQDGYLNLQEIKEIVIERAQISRYLLKKGDVLLTEGGDFDKLGRGTVWEEQITQCVHQNHVFVVRPDETLIGSYYLSLLTSSTYGRRYFLSCAKQTTNLASINSTQLRAFPVVLSPLPEQRAIAAILATWDRAIEQTMRLFEMKRKLKHGLMQQLLTGRREVDGKKGMNWDVVRFRELASPVKERYSPGEGKESVRCIELEHIAPGESRLIGACDGSRQASLKTPFRPGDVLFGKLRPYLRKFYLADSPGVCSSEIWVLRPNNERCSSDFLIHLVQSDNFSAVVNATSGSKMPRAEWGLVAEAPFQVPPLAEQERIASVLSAVDSEIALLRRIADQYTVQKQALMQKLLTGQVRVKVS